MHESEAKFLLFADDLVPLSSMEKGLQIQLDLLQNFCQTWGLVVNTNKTKVVIKRITDYNYLGLLSNKARQCHKKTNSFWKSDPNLTKNILISDWTNCLLWQWSVGAHLQIRHCLNGRNIQLRPCCWVLQNRPKSPLATNNTWRIEWGQIPLLIQILKRAIKFWKDLILSDPYSLHYKALQ